MTTYTSTAPSSNGPTMVMSVLLLAVLAAFGLMSVSLFSVPQTQTLEKSSEVGNLTIETTYHTTGLCNFKGTFKPTYGSPFSVEGYTWNPCEEEVQKEVIRQLMGTFLKQIEDRVRLPEWWLIDQKILKFLQTVFTSL